MENLSLQVLKNANSKGLCKSWALKIKSSKSIDDLLKMFVEGIDFCISGNFPTKEFLKEFGENKLPKYGIYIDEKIELVNQKWSIFLGNSYAKLGYNGYSVSELFVRHESICEVTVSDNAYLIIDCFEDCQLKINASNESFVLVSVYGNAKVIVEEESHNVKVIHKLKNYY